MEGAPFALEHPALPQPHAERDGGKVERQRSQQRDKLGGNAEPAAHDPLAQPLAPLLQQRGNRRRIAPELALDEQQRVGARLLLVKIDHGAAERGQAERKMHHHQPRADREQRPRRKTRQQRQGQSRQRIGAQHIVAGEQGRMDDADREQHDHAGIMRPPLVCLSAVAALLQQDQAPRPEQHREQGAELVLDEDEAGQPHPVISRTDPAETERIVIGRRWQREGEDVHPHDPDHRDTAQRVERGDALSGWLGGHHRRHP